METRQHRAGTTRESGRSARKHRKGFGDLSEPDGGAGGSSAGADETGTPCGCVARSGGCGKIRSGRSFDTFFAGPDVPRSGKNAGSAGRDEALQQAGRKLSCGDGGASQTGFGRKKQGTTLKIWEEAQITAR